MHKRRQKVVAVSHQKALSGNDKASAHQNSHPILGYLLFYDRNPVVKRSFYISLAQPNNGRKKSC
jgi:hypothetical protein